MRKRSVYTILLLFIWCSSASSQRLNLFSPEMKAAAPKSQVLVMDFLERYFQELHNTKYTSIETKMADDKVYFRKGKLADLSQVCDTMQFSINLLDRYYEVKWIKEGVPFVTIVFPTQYDLLLGLQKEEALKTIRESIVAAPQRETVNSITTDLIKVNDSIYRSKCDTLELASLNDAIYYNKVREGYKPVFDEKYMEYSAANLFQGQVEGADYRMYVEQSIFDLSKTENYTIMLSQWLNYCAEWGLKIFFAVEEVREDGILGLIIAQSKELGYHHLLSVVFPDKFISDKNAVLKVRMTPFIPIHNVKNMYQKQSITHKKVNWQ